eukprot:GFUD01001648.1.p1 GENE.GFUD01001648.1~~GFUD01001648.1.p1  ORF type:complete len:1115 (+),score=222.73 GFUD01001648.1:61-3405(+)
MGDHLTEHQRNNFVPILNDIEENKDLKQREIKMSNLIEKVENQNKRKHTLAEIREIVQHISKGQCDLNAEHVQFILADKRFCELFFNLFDENCLGVLKQRSWIEKLKTWTEVNPMHKSKKCQSKLDLVDLLESITYLCCQDKDIAREDFEKIISSTIVSKNLAKLLGDGENECTMEKFMDFIMAATKSCDLDNESKETLQAIFLKHAGNDKNVIGFSEFKKIIPSKDEFFVRRIFGLFDVDKSGTISVTEFTETLNQFSSDDDDSKIEFLFHIYDVNDDGRLYQDNFQDVITACMKENGMDFDDEQLTNLANALFMDGIQDGNDYMSLNDFKDQLQRQEGLLKNLASMINNWLIPHKESKEKISEEKFSEKLPRRYFTVEYWQNNQTLLSSMFCIMLMSLIIIIQRVYYFRNFSMLNGFTPNFFYMTSRACGKTILALSIIVLMLVLRKTITVLRNFGLASILPLDNNIYIHKIVGIIIFVLGCLHSLAHLLNFGINVQPDPVKFLQLTYKYWEVHYGVGVPLTLYNPPRGCEVVDDCSPSSVIVPEGGKPDDDCAPKTVIHQKKDNPDYVYNNGSFLCQVCDENSQPWTYAEWIFTTQPGLFGMPGGIANPTGIALLFILIIMFVCSLPFIRRRGHFEIFYFSHLLYHVYYVLLILHAPQFWKWFIPVGSLWAAERIYRIIHRSLGHGKSVIKTGVILPSKVTNLIIERPPGFNFSTGDWVFVNIPRLATSEWHPFTISSAPEVSGQFTLHIRGVGQWTNKLYELFEEEYARQERGYGRQESYYEQLTGSVRRRYRSVKKLVNKNSIRSNENDNFISNLKEKDFEERKRERMNIRESNIDLLNKEHETEDKTVTLDRSSTIGKYVSMKKPKIVTYESVEPESGIQIIVQDEKTDTTKNTGKKTELEKPLEIYIDGPFGSPSSNIYRAEHAVLIGTGIGITPFASILQSIMHRYWDIKMSCPNCNYRWTKDMQDSMFNLKKVDFFWINRDQKSFEWFVDLLSQLEIEQQEHGGAMGRFLDMHMYVTSALQKTDMKAVALQLALDILREKEERDMVTGLKARTNAGRPNWNKVFTKIREEKKGQVTIFFCGNPVLARTLRYKCEAFGFKFRKEHF